MECFRCDQQAVQECPRCGALYCDDHGEALCERCSDPALALPSYRVYRGSLVALLAGTVFAVWLLVRPPATTDADGPLPAPLAGVIATPAATVTGDGDQPPQGAEATATPATPATPAATATAEATATPATPATPAATATAEATAAPAASPPPSGGAIAMREHTVSDGDTLFSIAERYLPPDKDVLTFVEEIAAFNDVSDADSIVLGQVIRVPLQ